MGCDIHLYIEQQKYNTWKAFGGEYGLPRDYDMFGVLARVRNKTKYSYKPKGIPEDFSEDVDYVNGHNHSWLTVIEYENAIKQYIDYYSFPQMEYFIIGLILRYLENNGRAARVVFWFDN